MLLKQKEPKQNAAPINVVTERSYNWNVSNNMHQHIIHRKPFIHKVSASYTIYFVISDTNVTYKMTKINEKRKEKIT